MKTELTWYIARSAGLVAWLSACVAVLSGLFASTGLLGPNPTRPWLVDLHRLLSGLTVSFTAVHVLAIGFDDYVHFGAQELFVPMASAWRPGAVAWGVVALYLLVAVEVTSRLRRRLGERLWRASHWLSVVLLATSSVHAFSAGSDATETAVVSPAVGLLTFAIGVLWWRAIRGSRRRVMANM